MDERQRRILDNFLGRYREKANTVRLFGIPGGELTRDDLLASIAYLGVYQRFTILAHLAQRGS